jgi:uncharacterized peroxidase-related enzyme
MSLKPESLDAVKQLNEVVSFGNSNLSRVQEEAIATVVAVANGCRYRAMIHAGFLRRHSKNQQLASDLFYDHTQADLAPADRRMLEFAVRVTQEPGALTRDDVQRLRDVGLGESDILSIVLIACLSNFMDRLANSMGVELPPGYQETVDSWLTGPVALQGLKMHTPGEQPEETSVTILSVAPRRASVKTSSETPRRASAKTSSETPRGASGETPVEIPGGASGETPAETPGGASGETPAETPGGALGETPEGALDETPAETPGGALGETPEEGPDGEDQYEEVAPEPDATSKADSTLLRFIEECCQTGTHESATARDLYISYLRWCDDNDQQPMRQRDFGMSLSQLGYNRQRRAHGRHWWKGIGLKTAES